MCARVYVVQGQEFSRFCAFVCVYVCACAWVESSKSARAGPETAAPARTSSTSVSPLNLPFKVSFNRHFGSACFNAEEYTSHSTFNGFKNLNAASASYAAFLHDD